MDSAYSVDATSNFYREEVKQSMYQTEEPISTKELAEIIIKI